MEVTRPMSKQQGRDLEALPPSAKFVYKVLEYEAPLTQKEIIEETQLTQRTVYNALQNLEKVDVIDSHPLRTDLRQDVYYLK